MKSRVCPFLQRNENLIHQSSVRPSGQRVLLRFAHFGGSHHSHRFGDLRGIADRSDPATYVLRIRHLLESSFRPVTSRTLAHVKSDLAFLLYGRDGPPGRPLRRARRARPTQHKSSVLSKNPRTIPAPSMKT